MKCHKVEVQNVTMEEHYVLGADDITTAIMSIARDERGNIVSCRPEEDVEEILEVWERPTVRAIPAASDFFDEEEPTTQRYPRKTLDLLLQES